MLKVKKGSFGHGKRLAEADVDTLRKAFGRFARPEARPDGENLTRTLRLQDYWIACDCTKVGGRPPLLFPLAKGGIRREDRGYGTEHAETCVFERDAESQHSMVRSYGRSPRSADGKLTFRLVPPFEARRRQEPRQTRHVTTNRSRPGLARVLCELLSLAGLDRIGMGDGPRWQLDPQLDAIRAAAAHVDIAPGTPLDEWLALSLHEFAELKTKVAGEQHDWGGAGRTESLSQPSAESRVEGFCRRGRTSLR